MTKRLRLRGCPKLSPYGRMENELTNTREALGAAASAYTEALQALTDLLAYWDRGNRDDWTYADTLALERIRKIAEGK